MTDRTSGSPAHDERQGSWISLGFEELVQSMGAAQGPPDPFDVLIVGSGYGGAVAASELAGATTGEGKDKRAIRVCVLERGLEYLPGSFPSTADELAGHVRVSRPRAVHPTGRAEGLYDLRLGPDVNAIVANGLGGGSLINAGVMMEPAPDVLAKIPGDLAPFFVEARTLLGANPYPLADLPRKGSALGSLVCGKGTHKPADITVGLPRRVTDGQPPPPTDANVALNNCVECGDCASGCNFGAKNSLDVNLLVRAAHHGAEIYTGATVLWIERGHGNAGWIVHAVPTDAALRKRHGVPSCIHAKKLILAAGTFGSTEILLRSQAPRLKFSPFLGRRFSTNGDMIAVVYGHCAEANAVANEEEEPAQRGIGPTITSMIDLRGEPGTKPFVIEEISVPGPLRRVFEELFTTAHVLERLSSNDASRHTGRERGVDPVAVNPCTIRHSSVLAIMGDDNTRADEIRIDGHEPTAEDLARGEGEIELMGECCEEHGDGAVMVRWPRLRTGDEGRSNETIFDDQIACVEGLVAKSGVGGSVLPNPVWRLLPQKLSFLLDEARGPTLTVHPLGGCPIAKSRAAGVVNERGQVFNGAAQLEVEVFEDLVVLDGSIVPGALGVNPALTITAIALRASRELRDRWKFFAPPRAPGASLPPRTRPVFQVKRYAPKRDTEFAVLERLVGEFPVQLVPETAAKTRTVELTLRYRPTALTPLMSAMRRRLVVDPGQSTLRVFERDKYNDAIRLHKPVARPQDDTAKRREPAAPPQDDAADGHETVAPPRADSRPRPAFEWDDIEASLDQIAIYRARLGGTLRFFHREPSTARRRRCRALLAYARNRWLRDTWQFVVQWWRERGRKPGSKDTVWDRIRGAWALATHAGEARLFSYKLRALPWKEDGEPPREDDDRALFAIQGRKRLTYDCLANTFRQLETLALNRFGKRVDAKLEVDLRFFHKELAPLAKIIAQDNLARSLIELSAFGGYLLRLMVSVHIWVFRRPDSPEPRQPQRLPREIERGWLSRVLGLAPPRPRIQEITVACLPTGAPVNVRLTRYARFYCQGGSSARRTAELPAPVLLIHGYSASGTSFAHTAVRPCLAETLWKRGRDVWVVDLRTSSGMPTAALPWSFEDAALVDIPAAIDHVLRETGSEQLDVVAHCMGAAMLSMAVLKKPEAGDPLFDVRSALPRSIRRAVLSQVGPVVEFTAINVLRADVMRHTRRYLGAQTYDFRVSDSPSLAEQLQDRLLSSLKYPEDELRIENPVLRFWRRNEFVGTRHRIDALYGRAFSLGNLGRGVLESIDDFFGPLSLETVAQGMHLAQQNVVADRAGRNVYLDPETRDTRWIFPTLTLHAGDNGMVDSPATRERIERYFNFDDVTQAPITPPRVKTVEFPGLGHQDTLIGRGDKTAPVFDAIADFLDRDDPLPARNTASKWLFKPPWIGPILGPASRKGASPMMSAATDRNLGDAVFALLVAVKRVTTSKGEQFIPVKIDLLPGRQSSVYLAPAECDRDGWLSFRVPPNFMLARAEGFLVLLVYNQSPALLADPAWAAALAVLGELNRAGIPVPAQIGDLIAEEPNFKEVAQTTLTGAGLGAPTSTAVIDLIRQLVDLFNNREFKGLPEKDVKAELGGRSAAYFEPAFVRTQDLGGSVPDKDRAQIFLGSCQYPNGLLDLEPAWRSYGRLGKVLADSPADCKRVLLLVGDQIYSDSTAGLADPATPDERYRRPHEAIFSRPEVKAVLRRIPTVMMLDDHEIADNWEPTVDDRRPRDFLKEPLAAYKDFQRRAGPDFEDPWEDSTDPLWFEHALGDVQLFVADTRTERNPRRACDVGASRIMSDGQMQKLCDWLTRLHEDPATTAAPKFIASPSILLPRRIGMDATTLPNATTPLRKAGEGSIRIDSWEGYPSSRSKLLHHIASNRIRNVVFLSGDEHLFCRARIEISAPGGGAPHVVHSVHSSPLYAPYPFANSHPDEFPEVDRFELAAGPWTCDVTTTQVRARNGFTEIETLRDGPDWRVMVRVHDSELGAEPWTQLVF